MRNRIALIGILLCAVFFGGIAHAENTGGFFALTLKRKISSNDSWIQKLKPEVDYLKTRDPQKRTPIVQYRVQELQNQIAVLVDENHKLYRALARESILPSRPEPAKPAEIAKPEEIIDPSPVPAALPVVSPEPAHSKEPHLTGADWKSMEIPDKEMYVFQAFGRFEEKGIVLMKKPYFYIESIDQCLVASPAWSGKDLDYIFLMRVYESEPHVRGYFEKMAHS